jgi:hypothetical protein
MVRSFLVGALLALGLAGTAAAEPFQEYLDLCFTPDASARAAGSGAQGLGWVKLPEGSFGSDVPFQDPSVYLSLDPYALGDKEPPADMRMLITGWGEGEAVFGLDGMRVDLCAVAVMSGDADALRSRMASHFDFAPGHVDGDEVWAWSRQGSRLQSEVALFDEGQDPNTAVMGRKIFVAGVVDEDGMVMMILAAIRPSR